MVNDHIKKRFRREKWYFRIIVFCAITFALIVALGVMFLPYFFNGPQPPAKKEDQRVAFDLSTIERGRNRTHRLNPHTSLELVESEQSAYGNVPNFKLYKVKNGSRELLVSEVVQGTEGYGFRKQKGPHVLLKGGAVGKGGAKPPAHYIINYKTGRVIKTQEENGAYIAGGPKDIVVTEFNNGEERQQWSITTDRRGARCNEEGGVEGKSFTIPGLTINGEQALTFKAPLRGKCEGFESVTYKPYPLLDVKKITATPNGGVIHFDLRLKLVEGVEENRTVQERVSSFTFSTNDGSISQIGTSTSSS